MKKRYLILPFFLGSFFITSNVDSSVIDLYENKNSNNNLLIADCGGGGGGAGGGGGMSPKAKAEQEANRQKTKDAAKKRIIKARIAAGKSLTDKEKKFAANQVTNILKVLKNSLKNGNEAYTQILLKELFVDYGLGAMTDIGIADGTDDNYLKLIEMGDEGIDLLIKTFESALRSLER